MAKTAEMMAAKKISKEDNGSMLVDFEALVPGKEGKRLGKAVIRYVCLRTASTPAGVFDGDMTADSA